MRSSILASCVFLTACAGYATIENPGEDDPVTPVGGAAARPTITGVEFLNPPIAIGQPVLIDEAEIVSVTFPGTLTCAQAATAQVTVRNTGNTTWTKTGEYKLGAVDDSDPLSRVGRIDLGDTDSVAPNATFTFTLQIYGLAATGSSVSDWRMLKEGAHWFGGIASRTVATNCPPPGADQLDLSQVEVFNSPADVASWPITTRITQIEMHRANDFGLGFTFSALATWPDYTPPGWDGPLQYTVWAVVNVGGRWYTSGYIQMWNGRQSTGAPLLTDFAANWAYDGRWGPMMGHQPVVGEQFGFFVTAGNARGIPDVTSLRERSNVVVVSLPANDEGVFSF
jgi:hypothetical protein